MRNLNYFYLIKVVKKMNLPKITHKTHTHHLHTRVINKKVENALIQPFLTLSLSIYTLLLSTFYTPRCKISFLSRPPIYSFLFLFLHFFSLLLWDKIIKKKGSSLHLFSIYIHLDNSDHYHQHHHNLHHDMNHVYNYLQVIFLNLQAHSIVLTKHQYIFYLNILDIILMNTHHSFQLIQYVDFPDQLFHQYILQHQNQ